MSQSARLYSFPHYESRQTSTDTIVHKLMMQPWFRSTIERLHRFSSYGENWDGYGAHAISERAVVRTLVILYLVALGGPRPVVVPMSHGGIQVEWYYGGTEIEVDVPPTGAASIFVVRPDGNTNEATADIANYSIWSDLHSSILELNDTGV